MMDKVNSYLFSGGVDSGYWNKLDSVFTKFLKQENSVQIYYFKQLCQHWDLVLGEGKYLVKYLVTLLVLSV